MTTKKSNAGRPPQQVDYDLVKRLAGVGFSKRQIATVLDYTEEYFNDKAKVDLKLSEALAGAKEKMHSRLVGEIVQFALDSSIPYQQRRKDITFLLARRFGWTEKVQLTQEVPQLPEDVSFILEKDE